MCTTSNDETKVILAKKKNDLPIHEKNPKTRAASMDQWTEVIVTNVYNETKKVGWIKQLISWCNAIIFTKAML